MLSAAYLSSPQEARTADVGEWWKSFETNVKGALLCVQAFLSTACASLGPDTPSPAPLSPHATTTTATDPQPSPQDDDGNRRASPTILALTTGAISFPRHTTLGHSAYTSSKLAQTCLFEFVAAENSDVMVASVHPGMVATGIAEKAGMLNGRFERPMDSGAYRLLHFSCTNELWHGGLRFIVCVGSALLDDLCRFDICGEVQLTHNPSPTVSLPANFLVWMASPGARFLRGRVVWANWDVEELMQKRQEIEADETFLTVGVVGWDRLPYGGTA